MDQKIEDANPFDFYADEAPAESYGIAWAKEQAINRAKFWFWLFGFFSLFGACGDTIFFLSGWVPVDALSVALSWLTVVAYLGLFLLAKRNPLAASVCGITAFSLLSIANYVASEAEPASHLAFRLVITGLGLCLFLYILRPSLVYRQLKNKKRNV